MRPDLLRRALGAGRALMVGVALGVVVFAAGSLILYEAAGALEAAAGVVATFAAALAAGVWAGAPGARADTPPAGRWILAGAALGFAGVFATAWGLYQAERFGEAARAGALLFLIGVPVYALGLLLPALVAWERGEPDEEEEGEDGGVSAGRLGSATVAALVGVGVAVGAVLAGIVFLPGVQPGPLLLGTAALLTFPLFFPRAPRGEEATEEETLYEVETPYGALRVTEVVFPGKRQPERRLYQNEEIESGELVRTGAPTFAYIAAAERTLGALASAGQRYLFLGGGAYTLPRRVAEGDPSARITVVELDPEVTRVAYRFFGLRPEHGIATVHGDARRVAERLPAGSFDRVFVDVYDGTEAVPHHLVTVEGLAEVRRLLAPGGMALLNVIGVAEGEGALRFWSTARTLREAFPSLALYHHLGRDFPDRQNFLALASAEPGAAMPRMAGTFEAWPEPEWPPLPTTVFRDRAGADNGRAAVPPAGDGGAWERPAERRKVESPES